MAEEENELTERLSQVDFRPLNPARFVLNIT